MVFNQDLTGRLFVQPSRKGYSLRNTVCRDSALKLKHKWLSTRSDVIWVLVNEENLGVGGNRIPAVKEYFELRGVMRLDLNGVLIHPEGIRAQQLDFIVGSALCWVGQFYQAIALF